MKPLMPGTDRALSAAMKRVVRNLIVLVFPMLATGLDAAVAIPSGPQSLAVRNTTRTSVNTNMNAGRNFSPNASSHVELEADSARERNAIAAAASVVAASTATGSIARSTPPACVPVIVKGITYQQCGATWYQPQYAGTTVQYIVVNAPQ